jgi:hypothetical protein
VLNRSLSLSSIQLPAIIILFNSSNQISVFLECDAENRAHSTEWLAYSRLQTGDWLGSVVLLRDLFISDAQSMLTPGHYLPFAYRTYARTAVELFFWFPYSPEFLEKNELLLALNQKPSLVSLGENSTQSNRVWSEAAFRFGRAM